MLIYPINHSILMGSVVTFRSAYGSIVYISMVLLLVISPHSSFSYQAST